MPRPRKKQDYRECFCEYYDRCLTYAAKKNIELNCSGCKRFKEVSYIYVFPREVETDISYPIPDLRRVA